MQINLIFTTTVLHLASFWNVTEPHSASLSKRLSDSQKGFEILCPLIRSKLKNPGVCALGFSFAPCKGIRIPETREKFCSSNPVGILGSTEKDLESNAFQRNVSIYRVVLCCDLKLVLYVRD